MKFCETCEEWVEPETDEGKSLCPNCGKKLSGKRKKNPDDIDMENDLEDDDIII